MSKEEEETKKLPKQITREQVDAVWENLQGIRYALYLLILVIATGIGFISGLFRAFN